jgi:hypothetical protein
LAAELLSGPVESPLRRRQVHLEPLETARPPLELGEGGRDAVRVVAHRLGRCNGAREAELHGVGELRLCLLNLGR